MVDATCLIGSNTVWDQVQPFRPVQTNENQYGLCSPDACNLALLENKRKLD